MLSQESFKWYVHTSSPASAVQRIHGKRDKSAYGHSAEGGPVELCARHWRLHPGRRLHPLHDGVEERRLLQFVAGRSRETDEKGLFSSLPPTCRHLDGRARDHSHGLEPADSCKLHVQSVSNQGQAIYTENVRHATVCHKKDLRAPNFRTT